VKKNVVHHSTADGIRYVSDTRMYKTVHIITIIKQVRPSSGTNVYPYMLIYIHMPCNFTNGASPA